MLVIWDVPLFVSVAGSAGQGGFAFLSASISGVLDISDNMQFFDYDKSSSISELIACCYFVVIYSIIIIIIFIYIIFYFIPVIIPQISWIYRVRFNFLKCCRENFYHWFILQWRYVGCWRKKISTLTNCLTPIISYSHWK